MSTDTEQQLCPSTTYRGDEPVHCMLNAGHPGNHVLGTWSWPPEGGWSTVSTPPVETLTDRGPERDPGIEQHLTGRTHDDLFYELFERMARIERLLDPDAGRRSDYSALSSSLTNHFNRALTELGTGIAERHATVVQWQIDTTAKLNAIWKVLGAMAPIIDSLVVGEPCVQTERASGSPAPERCPTQFREGPCMGYAGHDGDCSTVTYQLPRMEDPEESEECGRDPYPGQGVPPCGLPAGHDGMHVSGPAS